VRAAMENLAKTFKKAKSRFYWFDFTIRGQRYRVMLPLSPQLGHRCSKAITSLVFRKIYRVFLRSRNTMCAWIVPRRVAAKYGLAILRQKGDLCKTEA